MANYFIDKYHKDEAQPEQTKPAENYFISKYHKEQEPVEEQPIDVMPTEMVPSHIPNAPVIEEPQPQTPLDVVMTSTQPRTVGGRKVPTYIPAEEAERQRMTRERGLAGLPATREELLKKPGTPFFDPDATIAESLGFGAPKRGFEQLQEESADYRSDVLKRAVINAPADAGRMAKEITHAVTNPQETKNAISGLISGIVEKVIPGTQQHEKYVDALMEFYADQYDEELLEAFADRPLTVISDGAAALSMIGASIKLAGKGTKAVSPLSKGAEEAVKVGETAIKAGEVIDPVLIAPKVAKKIVESLPDGSMIYKKMLRVPDALGTEKVQKVVDIAKKYRIPVTPKGVSKYEAIKADVGSEINKLVSDAEASGIAPNLTPIEYRKKFKEQYEKVTDLDLKRPGVKRTVDETLNNAVDLILDTEGKGIGKQVQMYENALKAGDKLKAKEIAKRYKLNEVSDVKITRLQDVKKNLTNKFGKYYDRDLTESAFTTTSKAVNDVSRELIAEGIPEIRQVNKQYGELKELGKYLDKASLRLSKGLVGFPKMFRDFASFGTSFQNPIAGAGIFVSTNVLSSAGFKSRLALGLHDIARAGKSIGNKSDEFIQSMDIFTPVEYKAIVKNEYTPEVVVGKSINIENLAPGEIAHTYIPTNDAYYGLKMDDRANFVSPTTYSRTAKDGTSATMRQIESPEAVEALYNKANIPEIAEPNFWELTSLEAGEVGKGSGSKLLRHFADVADENGRVLVVRPQPHRVKGKMVPKKALVKFYQRNGFKLVGKAYGPDTMMVRAPRSVNNVKTIPRKNGAIEYTTPNNSKLEGFDLNPKAVDTFLAGYGLKLDSPADVRILSKVQRGKGVTQGIGEGSVLFKKALQEADEQGKTVIWVAQSLGGKGLKQKDLVRWGEKLGAEIVSDADPRRIIMMKRPTPPPEKVKPISVIDEDIETGIIKAPETLKIPTARGALRDIRRGLMAGARRGLTDEFRTQEVE